MTTCCCGDSHTDDPRWPTIERFVADQGEFVQVTTPSGSWWIPRAFIALHGLKAEEIPALVDKYGWRPAT